MSPQQDVHLPAGRRIFRFFWPEVQLDITYNDIGKGGAEMTGEYRESQKTTRMNGTWISIALLPIVLFCGIASAADLYWDASGDNPANTQPGSGYWDTTTHANWSNGLSDSTWIDGSFAAFPLGNSSGGTITIDDNSGTVIASGIDFAYNVNPLTPSNYTIAAIPGDNLTLQWVGPVQILGTGTISAPIAGSAGILARGNLTLTGISSYTGPTEIYTDSSNLTLANGSALNNTAIEGESSAGLNLQGSSQAGTNGPGTAGATLGVSANVDFAGIDRINMVDGTIGTFVLRQESSFQGIALNFGPVGSPNTTLSFDLSSGAADEIVNVGPGTARVLGSNIINISTASASYLTPGNYPLISVPAGGLTSDEGTFDFANGTTIEPVSVNGNNYVLTLNNSDTLESLTVSLPEPTTLAIAALSAALLLRRRARDKS